MKKYTIENERKERLDCYHELHFRVRDLEKYVEGKQLPLHKKLELKMDPIVEFTLPYLALIAVALLIGTIVMVVLKVSGVL